MALELGSEGTIRVLPVNCNILFFNHLPVERPDVPLRLAFSPFADLRFPKLAVLRKMGQLE